MIPKRAVRLSDAQFVALIWAVGPGGGKLVRRPGGFWTIPSMSLNPRRSFQSYRVPLWHTGTHTVMAMERLDLVKRNGEEPNLQYWLAPRVVTDDGRRALEIGIADGQRERAEKKWNLVADLKLYDEFTFVSDQVKKGLGI